MMSTMTKMTIGNNNNNQKKNQEEGCWRVGDNCRSKWALLSRPFNFARGGCVCGGERGLFLKWTTVFDVNRCIYICVCMYVGRFLEGESVGWLNFY